MVEITSLIKNDALKTTYWNARLAAREKPEGFYDRVLDSFCFQFSQGKTRVLVHYVDQFVSVLFRESDNEIVGLSIDSFSKFFSTLVEKKIQWKLSDSGIDLKGNDFVINCKKESSFAEIERSVYQTAATRTKKEGILLPSLN